MNRRDFIKNMFISAAVSAPVAAGVSRLTPNHSNLILPVKNEHPLLNRVLGDRRLRFSYTIYPPYCVKNPNTGKLSGVYVEVMEEMAQKLGVSIEWVEEVGWGTVFEGLDSERYDMHGFGLWRNTARGKRAYFSIPIFYSAIYTYVRSDETRLKTLDDLNSPDVRIAVQDGSVQEDIAMHDFPKAQRISMPQTNPWSDALLNIITGKADVTFTEVAVISPFLEKNPGTLKELKTKLPIRVYANAFPFKMGEDKFKSVIDSAIEELINSGAVEKIILKYEKNPGEMLRVGLPYQLNT